MAIFTVADPNRQTLSSAIVSGMDGFTQGMVRVVFELTDVGKEDGGTHFIVGSHKANFPMHPDHMSVGAGKAQPVLDELRLPSG